MQLLLANECLLISTFIDSCCSDMVCSQLVVRNIYRCLKTVVCVAASRRLDSLRVTRRSALNPITGPVILSNESVREGSNRSPCFSGTNVPIILKFGMLMARTILMDFPLIPEQNIRNFRKNSGINIFPEFSGKPGIF